VLEKKTSLYHANIPRIAIWSTLPAVISAAPIPGRKKSVSGLKYLFHSLLMHETKLLSVLAGVAKMTILFAIIEAASGARAKRIRLDEFEMIREIPRGRSSRTTSPHREERRSLVGAFLLILEMWLWSSWTNIATSFS